MTSVICYEFRPFKLQQVTDSGFVLVQILCRGCNSPCHTLLVGAMIFGFDGPHISLQAQGVQTIGGG
jgi:hypothetical protein